MSRRTDIHHGRQGGRFAPDGYEGLDLGALARCVVCGHPMAVARGRDRHYMCDTASIVGLACTCPPDCTDTHVGDRGTCDPGCEVCSLLVGVAHADVPAWRRTRIKKSATT